MRLQFLEDPLTTGTPYNRRELREALESSRFKFATLRGNIGIAEEQSVTRRVPMSVISKCLQRTL